MRHCSQMVYNKIKITILLALRYFYTCWKIQAAEKQWNGMLKTAGG